MKTKTTTAPYPPTSPAHHAAIACDIPEFQWFLQTWKYTIQFKSVQHRIDQLSSARFGSAQPHTCYIISYQRFLSLGKCTRQTRQSFARFSVNGVRLIFIAVRAFMNNFTQPAGRFPTMRLPQFNADKRSLVEILSWVFESNQPVAIIFCSESLNKTTYPNRSTVISIESEGHNRTTFDYSAFVFQRQTGSGGYPAVPRILAKLPLSEPRL